MKQYLLILSFCSLLSFSSFSQDISFVNADTSVSVYTPDLFLHTIEHLYMVRSSTDTITVDWFLTVDVPQVMNPNSGQMENAWDIRVCDEILCHNEPSGQTTIPPTSYLYDWHFQLAPAYFLGGVWELGTGTATLQVRDITDPGTIISTSANITTTETVGIKDIITKNISVYPNPTANTITIDLENSNSFNNILLTNLNGQTIKNMNMDNQTRATLDLSGVAKGLYHIRLTNDDGQIMSSQLIEKQ